MRFRHQATNDPVFGADVRTCASSDFSCSNPLYQAKTDEAGHVHLEAALSFPGPVVNGYLQFEGGSVGDGGLGGLAPTLGFIFPPLAGPMAGDSNYTPYESKNGLKTELDLLATILQFDSKLGLVFFLTKDCLNGWGSGLIVDPVPVGAKVYYAANGVPTSEAKATDRTGLGVVANLATGPFTVSLRTASTKQLVAESVVIVREGWITSALMAPLPQQ